MGENDWVAGLQSVLNDAPSRVSRLLPTAPLRFPLRGRRPRCPYAPSKPADRPHRPASRSPTSPPHERNSPSSTSWLPASPTTRSTRRRCCSRGKGRLRGEASRRAGLPAGGRGGQGRRRFSLKDRNNLIHYSPLGRRPEGLSSLPRRQPPVVRAVRPARLDLGDEGVVPSGHVRPHFVHAHAPTFRLRRPGRQAARARVGHGVRRGQNLPCQGRVASRLFPQVVVHVDVRQVLAFGQPRGDQSAAALPAPVRPLRLGVKSLVVPLEPGVLALLHGFTTWATPASLS